MASCLVNNESQYPGYGNLEYDRKSRPFPAVRFRMNRSNRRGAGNIEQGKQHHAVCVEFCKSHLPHADCQIGQCSRRIDIDPVEEYGKTGNDDFLG